MLVVPSWHIALSPSRIRIKSYELGKKGFHDLSNKSFIYYLYKDYASAYRDIRRRKEKAGSQRLIARTTFRGNNGLIVGRGSRSTMFIEARRKEGANYARERARRRGKVTRSTAWKQRPIEAKGRNNVVELYGSSVDDRVDACKTRITIDRTGHACVRNRKRQRQLRQQRESWMSGFDTFDQIPRFDETEQKRTTSLFLRCCLSWRGNAWLISTPLQRRSSFHRLFHVVRESEKPSSEISGRDNSRCDNERKIWALLRLSASWQLLLPTTERTMIYGCAFIQAFPYYRKKIFYFMTGEYIALATTLILKIMMKKSLNSD